MMIIPHGLAVPFSINWNENMVLLIQPNHANHAGSCSITGHIYHVGGGTTHMLGMCEQQHTGHLNSHLWEREL